MQLRIKDSSNLSLVEPLSQGRPSSNSFLKQFLTTLFRRKWSVLLLFCVIVLGTTAYALLTPSRYKATMKILVKNERVDSAVSAEDHTWTDRKPVSEEAINSEIELLKSSDLLRQVSEKLNLDKRPAEPGMVGKLLGRNRQNGKPMEMDGAIQNLQSNLEVNPIKKADIIEITYSDNSPEIAAAVLKQLADDYLEKHLILHKTKGAYDFFKTQASETQQELRNTQEQLTGFRQRNEVTDLDTQKKLNLNYQADLEKTLLKTEADIQDATKKVEVLKRQIQSLPARIETQIREIPNQFAIERFNTLLVELQNKRTLLLTKFHEDDRMVQEIDQEIKDTRIALEKAEKFKALEKQSDPNPIRMALEPELNRLEATLAGLWAQKESQVKQLASYRARLSQLEGSTLKNNELEIKVKQAEESYKLYAKKEEEARISESLDEQKIANVMVAEAPLVPSAPYKPNRPLTMVLGTIIGLFMSLSFAFMQEYFSETIHSTDELENFTGLPVLATIPISGEYENRELELIHPVGLISPVEVDGLKR